MAKRDEVPGLPAKLKAAREKAGLSQVAVEKLSGVASVNISGFENGVKTPTIATLYKLADAYGIDPCDLLPKPSEVAPVESEPIPATPPAKRKRK